MPKYKHLIVADLDGTLLNSEGKLSEATINFVRELNKRDDVLFTFSTGRSWQDAEWIYNELQLKGFVSCSNGSHIHDPKQGIQVYSYLDYSTCFAILENDDFFKNFRDGVIITDEEYINFDSSTDRSSIIKKIKERSLRVYYLKCVFENIKTEMARTISNDRLVFLKELNHPPAVTVYEYEEFKTLDFEIQDYKTDKGKFIKFLNVYYGVPKSKIISFGDQINDLAMALGPSYFVSMKNAVLLLKCKSRKVSKFTNDEDGVIKEVDVFLKKQNQS